MLSFSSLSNVPPEWLQGDALRFLMVAFPHPTGQHHALRRHILEHHVSHLHPIHIINAIVRSGGPLFGGNMGSYEVSPYQVLLVTLIYY